MKRIFWLLAAAAVAITACNKPQYIIPIDDDDKQETPDDPDTGYKEKTWTFTLEDVDPFTEDYAQGQITLPGDEICDFFGLTQEEFYKGMGTLGGNSDEMTTYQENNTIMFGLAEKNNTDDLKWIPRTSSGIGHWLTAEGGLTTWGSETNLAVFYTENHLYTDGWGQDSPDAETLAEQWVFDFGYRPGRPEPGKTYKATAVYFYTDDDDVECYAYIEFILKTKDGKRDTWSDGTTVQVGGEAGEIYPELDELAAFFGLADADALYDALVAKTIYPVGINADGSQYLTDGKPYYSQVDEDADWGSQRGVFFSADGDCTTWNSGTDHFYSTMYWYMDGENKTIEVDITPFAATEEHVGQHTFTWGFTNGTEVAYLVINITLETAVPWSSYSVEDFVYTVNMIPNSNYKGMRMEFDNEALAAALGVEDLVAGINDASVKVVGLNADGTVAMNPNDATAYWNTGEGPFGHWFNTSGNVCGWSTDGCAVCLNIKTDDVVYVNICQFPDTCQIDDKYTVKQRFIAGDKTVDITYNISIVEAI